MRNGRDTPLNISFGNVPNVGSAMLDWFQPLVFGLVTKVTQNFQVLETTIPVSFQGVWQPLSDRQLQIKPEGQRAWSWYWVHADPSLRLEVDSVVTYLGDKYRVMALKDYSLYGYMEYHLIEDYKGAGPKEVCP